MGEQGSIYLTVKALGKQLLAQDAAFKTLINRAGLLECVIDKTRSEQIKNAVHDLLSVLQTFRDSREQVTRSYNVVVDIVKKEEAAKSVPSVSQAAEPPVIARRDMETQSPCWWDVPHSAVTEEAVTLVPGPSWTEVVRRRKTGNQTTSALPEATKTGQTAKDHTKQQPRVRSRPSAILVDVKAEDFPELAKKIRGGVNKEIIGDSIMGVRQAKSGGLLIEVRGDYARVDAIRAEVARTAGSEVDVRALQQRALLEVRDLDQWTSSEEVRDAVAISAGGEQDVVKVVSLRSRFGGSQMALVSLPLVASRKLLNSGRLRVGMVSCRVRLADTKVRCFHCLAFGHTSKSCDGPDRTECCRRCGEAGHKAASCSAPASAVSAFAKVLGAANTISS